TLPVGSHALSAQFTSSDQVAFNDSTSAPVTFLVKPPPTPTTTTLTVTPSGPVGYGTSVTLGATVSPQSAGTVTFFDGTTALGSKPVSAGAASLTTIGLGGGTQSLTASFAPTAPTDFAPSTSAPATSLTVTALATTTSLAVTPAGPVTRGASVTLTATITPSVAVGSVTFRNGTAGLATVAVSGGKAILHTTKLPIGKASLTAAFAGTKPANYTASSSSPVTLSVVAPPAISSITSGGKTLKSGAVLRAGQVLTLHASGFQPNETVTVTVHSAIITLAKTKANASGNVTVSVKLPTSLAAGKHTLTLAGRVGQVGFTFSIASTATAPATPTPTPGGTDPSSGGGGNLASTGADVIGGTVLGLALTAGGAVALLLATRRRRGLHRAG
ncbi:MAG: repeat-containing protein, partial [Pseudonocardiales bacterium]|nr:repeat-containing protein [Pseudonocardiales bacterium]